MTSVELEPLRLTATRTRSRRLAPRRALRLRLSGLVTRAPPVAVSPSGRTAYVVNAMNGNITPIAPASGRKGRPISVGLYAYPTQIDMLPSGLAIVVSPYGGQITLLNTDNSRAVATVSVGNYPDAVAVAD